MMGAPARIARVSLARRLGEQFRRDRGPLALAARQLADRDKRAVG
jgi:hypothetical protein